MNFLDLFYTWLIESGRRKKVDGRDAYAGSIGKGSANGYLIAVRKMFVTLGYVKKLAPGKYSVVSGENWRKISIPEIKRYIQSSFPPGERMTPRDKNRRSSIGIAIKKFGQFMVHSQKLWTDEKLFELQKLCSYSHVDYQDLVIEPPNKAHAFCEWVWKTEIAVALPMFLGQWLGGMRYIEVRDAKVDLKAGSLEMNYHTGKAIITGKGAEGKPRFPAFDELVKKKLDEYLKWRATINIDSDSLALRPKYHGIGKMGESVVWCHAPLSENSGVYNNRLRTLAVQYNDEMREAGREDLVMDVELCTSHKLGRHVFGTYFGKKIPESSLAEYMGIESEKVLRKYINFTWDEKMDMYSSVTATYLNGGGKPRPISDVTVALDGIRQFAPKGKEVPWNSLVDGLIGLVT